MHRWMRNSRAGRGLALLAMFCLIFTAGAAARDRGKKKKKMDPTRGEILLAGLVYEPASEGGNHLGAGISAVTGATVILEGTGYETETDVNGFFVFTDGPDGDVKVIIKKDGYRTETRMAKIARGASQPSNLRIEMLPAGTNYVGKTPVSPGTLYVAYSQRRVEQSGAPGGHSPWDKNLQTISSAIAAGADPLTLEHNDPGRTRIPGEKPGNPTNGAPNSIMMLPPNSPTRAGFHNLSVSPYWLCFDKDGSTLYVANAARQIQVLDAAHENRILANLPVQQNGVCTSLSLSADGQYVMGTVMAPSPGVMMIDTKSKAPVAYLAIDNVGTMTPTSVATNPDSSRVFVTLDGQAGKSGQGLLVALDPYTGMTLGSVPVGSKPTGVVLSKDGRLAYVANSGGGNVTVVDAWSMAPIGILPVGAGPQKLAITPDGRRIFVTNKGSSTVSVIDPMANAVVGTVSVGKSPLDVKVSPDGRLAFVSNKDDGTITVIDVANQAAVHVTDPMPQSSPYGLAVRP